MTNGTFALDTTTMTHALSALSREYGAPWVPARDNELQELFFGWYEIHAAKVANLRNLKGLVSPSARVLNNFLKENGFQPLFREIGGGLGAVSILDMLVEWAVAASRTSFYRYTDLEERLVDAFSIPANGVEFFELPLDIGEGWLAQLHAKDGSSVWLLTAERPSNSLDMVRTAMTAMENRRPMRNASTISEVVVPTLDIDIQPSLSWMHGASCGGMTIDQAFQQFKLRMTHQGARVKVASGFATRGGNSSGEQVVFDSPFIGWFTQPGSELPLATFYADVDSWKTPKGSLTDM